MGIAVAIAGVLGLAAGWLGVTIEIHNVSRYGAAYSRYIADFLSIPALPGMWMVEYRLGYDLQLGEISSYRRQAVGWNGICYAAAVGIVWGFHLLVYRSNPPNK